jgi:hypothetical protein
MYLLLCPRASRASTSSSLFVNASPLTSAASLAASKHLQQLDLPARRTRLLRHITLMMMVGIGILAAPRAILGLTALQFRFADHAAHA